MAANDIMVSLGLDDKDYTSKLKSAEASANSFGAKFAAAFAKGKGSLDTAASSVDNFNSKIDGLTNALVGVGITAFVAGLVDSAGQLDDMAKSIDTNISRLLEMGIASGNAGGSLADVASQAQKMLVNISGAADGNIALRQSFRELGVSAEDFKNKSTDQIYNTIALALSKIPDSARRAALATDVFGKSAKNTDWKGYIDGLVEASGKMDSVGESQKKLADISDRMSTQMTLVKTKFAEILSPLVSLLAPTGDLDSQMNKASITAGVLAGALGLFGLSSTVNAIRSIGGAIASLALFFTGSAAAATADTLAVGANSVSKVANAAASTTAAMAATQLALSNQAAAIAELELSIATDKATGAYLRNNAAMAALEAKYVILEGQQAALAASTAATATATSAAAAAQTDAAIATTALTARFAAFIPVAQVAALALLAFWSTGLNKGEDEEIAKIQKLQDALSSMSKEELANYFKLNSADQKRIADQLIMRAEAKKTADVMAKITGEGATGGGGPLANTGWKDLTAAAQEQSKQIGLQTGYINSQNARIVERLQLENSLIGSSKAVKDAKLLEFDSITKRQEQMKSLQEKINALEVQKKSDPKKFAAEGSQLVIDAYEKQKSSIKDTTQEVVNLKNEENARTNALQTQLFSTKSLVDANRQITDLNDKAATMFLPEIAKKYAEIELAARAAAEAQIASEEARRGAPLTDEEKLKYYEAARQKVDQLKESTLLLNEAEKKLSLGNFKLQERISLENEILSIQDTQAKLTMTELEKKQYDIAAAAKARAKAEIDAAEKSRGAPLNAAEQQAYYDAAIAGIKGRQDAEATYYAKSQEWSTGWAAAFAKYTDEAANAANTAQSLFQTATQGMEDAFMNFAKTGKWVWGDFLNQMLQDLLRSQVRSTLANLMSGKGFGGGSGSAIVGGFQTLGKMLGFANGGLIPTNSPVLVGERGPEILTGVGGRTVIPNEALGGGVTNVTYNISAVDARSFQQMVARDPSFIHAVAEQGRKSLPQTRR